MAAAAIKKPASKKRRRLLEWRSTREGKVFLFVTLGVGIAAVNTGNNLLFLMLGFTLSLVLLGGVMNEIVIWGVRLRRHLPSRAFAGTPCVVEIEIENTKKRFSSYSIQLEDLLEAGTTAGTSYVLKIPPQGSEFTTYRWTPRERGRTHFALLRVGTEYPFGIIAKSRRAEQTDELVVYPRLAHVTDAALSLTMPGLDAPSGQPGHGSEIAGVRDHELSDSAGSIHWRRTASLGRLVVRARERDVRSSIALLVDNGRPAGHDAAWSAAFEHQISLAAALTAHALGHGVSVEVVARTSRSPLVDAGQPPDAIWYFLALLAPVDRRWSEPPAPPDRPLGRVVDVAKLGRESLV